LSSMLGRLCQLQGVLAVAVALPPPRPAVRVTAAVTGAGITRRPPPMATGVLKQQVPLWFSQTRMRRERRSRFMLCRLC
jgi:hypothetical protein